MGEGRSSTELEYALLASWAVSLIALCGSLFFSEIKQYEPCELCWYQRILMYPLPIIQGIALARKDYRQSLYVFPLAVIGAGISVYHYMLQKAPFMQEQGGFCGIVPCNGAYINWFGFVTIPLLALTAFLIIAALNIYIWLKVRGEKA